MVVRKVNGKLPDANSNVNVGTVTSINDISPNSSGELTLPINIPNGKFITVEELMLPTMLDSGNYMVAISDGTILPYENQCMVNVAIFDTGTPNYKGKVLTVTNVGDGDGNNGKFEASVKIQSIDIDENLVMGDPDWIPYKPEVHDNLDSTDTDIALSANMGKVLYDMNNFIMDELEEHIQQGASAGALGHVRIDNDTIKASANTHVISVSTASETQKGAVKVDGETITIDENGVIKAVGGGSGESVPDASLTVKGKVQLTNEVTPGASESLALTQKGANNLYLQNNELAISFDNHMSHVASDGNLGTLGHVKPDGITITADEEGVISVIGGASATLSDDYMLNDSNVASSTKATTNLANDFVDNINDLNAEDTRLQSVINIVSGQLTTHESVKASETVLGHVMVDGTTIQIDADGIISAVSDYDITNDEILPTTPASEFSNGLTISAPRAGASNVVYVAWKDWVISTSGANLDYALPFYVYIETTRSDTFYTMQTIRVIAPSFGVNGYNEVMHITRCALTETGDFNAPGVQMNTIRGSGNPEGNVHALIGNSYYDYTNKVMYVKTEEGPVDPKANGWVLSNIEVVDNILTQDSNKALSANMGYVLDDRMDDLYDEQERLASFMSEFDQALNAHKLVKASDTVLGHVIADGDTILIDGNGIIRTSDKVVHLTSFNLEDAPNSYGNNTLTICTLQPSAYMSIINSIISKFTSFKWTELSNYLHVITKRNADLEYSQEIYINYYDLTNLYPIPTYYVYGKLTRYSSNATLWGDWTMEFTTFNGKSDPNGTQPGIVGNKYLNTVTGEMWVKRGTNATINVVGWTKLAPTVVNNTYAPVSDDMNNVYSAYTTSELLTSHASTKATESALGHVKVDGTTITVDDGVISATQLDIIDNFITDDATKVLSAKRGKLLYEHVIGVDVDFASHKTNKASDLTLGHVKVDGSTIQINNDGIISTVPIRINNQYVRGALVAGETELTLDVSSINMTDVTLEVYDSGLLLFDDDYDITYNEEDDELHFEWVAKPYSTIIMVKISRIGIAYN